MASHDNENGSGSTHVCEQAKMMMIEALRMLDTQPNLKVKLSAINLCHAIELLDCAISGATKYQDDQ